MATATFVYPTHHHAVTDRMNMTERIEGRLCSGRRLSYDSKDKRGRVALVRNAD